MSKRWVSIWFPNLPSNKLDELCQKAKQYTPVTALDEPDGLLLDVTGCAHLFGGEAALLSKIEADFTAQFTWLELSSRATTRDPWTPAQGRGDIQGVGNAQVAIAPNPQAAWALSHFKPGSRVGEQNLSKILGELPIGSLRLPEKTERMLEDLSINWVSELLVLPRQQLLKRFGIETLRCLDRALGAQLSLVESVPEHKIWRLKEEFVEPIRYSEMLCQALVYVLKKLCLLLEQEQLGATAIQVILTRLDHVKISLSIGTAAPTHNAAHLEKLLKLKLERVDLGLGIEVIELEATRVAPVIAHQLGMTGQDEMAPQNLLDWRDLISNRLGSKALFYMAPRESHIPERAVVRHCEEAKPTRQSSAPLIASRPIRFLHPPEPIGVTAMLPDSPPAQIRWRGRVLRVVKADGPERIEPEWWLNPTGTPRDYYRIENQEGLRLWVFRQGTPAQWYLQGMFA